MKISNYIFFPLLLMSLHVTGANFLVKNNEELNQANKEAKPGDIIILKNQEWNNVTITLTCNGTKEHPIVVKAETAGKVIISGKSMIRISGTHLIVDGLYFVNGYAGEEPVISFRTSKIQVANNCRVTNTVINDFNTAKRLEENYWVALYGKNNRVDHCSFINKKNLGVLLAVLLDDEKSRENFHIIDHNYFGLRIPLASNGGEIIRVGLSQNCQFNSNTQISDNVFEHCDGEAEVISIKSGENVVRNNVFKECQGSVVLRHGDNNTVENNIFFGNNKQGTGGVRVINKGQWIVNNYFYKCRGTGFRSPLTIMNGVPNSPADRYVGVSDAVICNNAFYECAPMSLCEGSDKERSVVPYNVSFINNVFYNTRDSILYKVYDDISKIDFSGNWISQQISQQINHGFQKVLLATKTYNKVINPEVKSLKLNPVRDSLNTIGSKRILSSLSNKPGLSNIQQIVNIAGQGPGLAGAQWFKSNTTRKNSITVNCKTPVDIKNAIAENKDKEVKINLTGDNYRFNSPLRIEGNVTITSSILRTIRFSLESSNSQFLMLIEAGSALKLQNLQLDLSELNAASCITTDTAGLSDHSNFSMKNCSVTNNKSVFLHGARASVCDSIMISKCSFVGSSGSLFNWSEETDNKGYYNVEKLVIGECIFSENKGPLFSMLRTGKDESTLGPKIFFTKNKLNNCSTEDNEALISLKGVQYSFIEENNFTNCNYDKTLIEYKDWVKANHNFKYNKLTHVGRILKNEYLKIIP